MQEVAIAMRNAHRMRCASGILGRAAQVGGEKEEGNRHSDGRLAPQLIATSPIAERESSSAPILSEPVTRRGWGS